LLNLNFIGAEGLTITQNHPNLVFFLHIFPYRQFLEQIFCSTDETIGLLCSHMKHFSVIELEITKYGLMAAKLHNLEFLV